MKKLIFVFFLFNALNLYSQQPISENKADSTLLNFPVHRKINLMGELGGNGGFYSVGLEHAKFKKGILQDTFRYGLSFTPSTLYGNFLSAFAEFNTEFGNKNNYFELGAGPTIIFSNGPLLIVTGRIGYRFNSDHFIFRAGFTPLFFVGLGSTEGILPWAGISFGIPL
jgi:hypothetical protein